MLRDSVCLKPETGEFVPNFTTLRSEREKRSASGGTPKIPDGSFEICAAFDFQPKFLAFRCNWETPIDQYSRRFSCFLLFSLKPHLPSSQGTSFHL